jgi:hypothetical protein
VFETRSAVKPAKPPTSLEVRLANTRVGELAKTDSAKTLTVGIGGLADRVFAIWQSNSTEPLCIAALFPPRPSFAQLNAFVTPPAGASIAASRQGTVEEETLCEAINNLPAQTAPSLERSSRVAMGTVNPWTIEIIGEFFKETVKADFDQMVTWGLVIGKSVDYLISIGRHYQFLAQGAAHLEIPIGEAVLLEVKAQAQGFITGLSREGAKRTVQRWAGQAFRKLAVSGAVVGLAYDSMNSISQ